MGLKRFLSGQLMEGDPIADGNIPSQLDRRVLIVYTGSFQSVDGPVEVGEEEISLLASTHNSFLMRLKHAVGGGEIPVRMNPPLQLDHSTSARDTVGRLVGGVEPGPHRLTDGTEVKGLFGNVRILGRENVEKYLDGRYSNVSIGADFKTGKISELTITPFPAAEEATLMSKLSEGSFNVGGKKFHWRNNPNTGKIDISDSGGDHIGVAPSVEAAKTFVEKEVKAGNLSKLSQGETMDPKQMAGLKHHFEGLAHHMGEYMDPAHKQEHMSSLEGLKKHFEAPTDDGPTAMNSHCEIAKKHLEAMKGKPFEENHLAGMKHHMDGLAHYSGMSEVGATEGPTSMKSAVEEMKKHLEGMSAPPADPKAPAPAALDGAPAAADETKPEHMAAKLKDGMVRMAEMQKKMLIASKKMSLSTRLNGIKRLGKITPAELSKIDLTKLAGESDATQEAVLKSYENREPQVLMGMMGTAKADDLSAVSKEMRVQRMMKEARQNMPLKRAEMENKLSALGGSRLSEDDKEKDKDKEKEKLSAPSDEEAEMSRLEAEVNKLMDEGKVPEAKEKLKAYMESVKKKTLTSTEVHDDAHKEMSALAEDITKLQNEMSGVVKLAAGK